MARKPLFGDLVFASLLILAAFLAADSSFAAELLGDPGFKLSTPNGTFPDSGAWKKAW